MVRKQEKSKKHYAGLINNDGELLHSCIGPLSLEAAKELAKTLHEQVVERDMFTGVVLSIVGSTSLLRAKPVKASGSS